KLLLRTAGGLPWPTHNAGRRKGADQLGGSGGMAEEARGRSEKRVPAWVIKWDFDLQDWGRGRQRGVIPPIKTSRGTRASRPSAQAGIGSRCQKNLPSLVGAATPMLPRSPAASWER